MSTVQSGVVVFDLHNVTEAISAAWRSQEAWEAMVSDMQGWHAMEFYPDVQALAAAIAATEKYTVQRSNTGAIRGTCLTMASNILKWAKSGMTPKTIGDCVNAKPGETRKGRATGKGKGKSTIVADVDTDAVNDGLFVSPSVTQKNGMLCAAWFIAHCNEFGLSAGDQQELADCGRRIQAIMVSIKPAK